jgi:hypothetical protein
LTAFDVELKVYIIVYLCNPDPAWVQEMHIGGLTRRRRRRVYNPGTH